MTNFPRKISRRTALTLVAGVMPVAVAGSLYLGRASAADWVNQDWGTPSGPGYGPDPELDITAPWPPQLTPDQRSALAKLVDIIIPADTQSPSASEAGLVDFLDEWVSSPYPITNYSRHIILNGLIWIDKESNRRFGVGILDAPALGTEEMIETILPIYEGEDNGFVGKVVNALSETKSLRLASAFLQHLHFLTVTGYYITDVGRTDIGYLGDRAMSGPYAGPSDEARSHIRQVILDLGLELPKELT